MLKNYLTVAARQLVKNGPYTVINIVGLAVVLAWCIVAYVNYDFSFGFDAFHEKANRIYRVNSIKVVNDREQQWGITPMPLGPALKEDFAFVTEAVRLSRTDAVLQADDKVLNETVYFADEGFFDLFTFPLKAGAPGVLQDPNKIVLSEEGAVKYFGDADPMGRQVTLRFGDAVRSFTVGAVVEKIPKNSSIQFDVLIPYATLRVFGDDLGDWQRWGLVTFIEVSEPARLADLSSRFPLYLERQNAAHLDWQIERFFVQPLPEMFLTSEDTRGYVLVGSVHPASIVSPAILAVLLLLMACFNFMNTSMAFADRRLKEIGVRKVVGGLRRQLIGQFMGESMLLCVLAFGLALLLATVLVPAYSSLWPYLDLRLDLIDNAPLLVFLAALLLVTGLIAGAYPAIYLSSFKPVHILKGHQRLRGTNAFTRTLLTFQFSIAVLVIIASIAFTNNARYQETFDLGYEEDRVLVVPLGEPARYTPYRDALLQNPNILSVAGSRNHVGFSAIGKVAQTAPTDRREALKSEVVLYLVGAEYVTTMGLRLADGRTFEPDRETDFTSAVLVNETLAHEFGWTRPVGQTVEMDSVRYQVVGVLEDFYENVWDVVDPSLFRLTRPEAYRYLTARVRGEDLVAANTFLRQTWRQIAPDTPYAGFYQDEVMAEAILINRSIKTAFYYIAAIAIVIAAAGLFALVSLNIARRTKEIGIRKVFGASVLSISHLINKEFVILLLIASAIASGAGYFSIQALLGSIWAYHVELDATPFLLATFLIFLIALVTVGRQVYRIATSNPVHALRYE